MVCCSVVTNDVHEFVQRSSTAHSRSNKNVIPRRSMHSIAHSLSVLHEESSQRIYLPYTTTTIRFNPKN